MIFDKINELMDEQLMFSFDELDQTVEKDFNFTLDVGLCKKEDNKKKFSVMDIAMK